jgi:predicted Zn-dependent peptidase
MKVVKTTLKNDLRVLIVPMPNLESATLTVWTAVGSRYESKKNNGVSHFLEHMVFKGGNIYNSPKKVAESIDAIGGQINASTGKETTNFYVKARASYIETGFKLLSDILLTPKLMQSDINREKGVIKSEIDMYEDLPMRKVEEVFENLIYKGNPLDMDIAGTKQTVDGLNQSDFKKYISTHYNTDNMLITVAGGVKDTNIKSLAQKYFGGIMNGNISKYKQFNTTQIQPQLKVINKKTDQVHMIIGYVGNPRGNKDRYAESVLATILGCGMSSRLFTEVREKRGLAYSVHASADHYRDTGSFAAYTGVDKDKSTEALKTILKEFQKMTNQSTAKISSKELSKAKEYIKGNIALSLEDTSDVNYFFGTEELLLGKTRSIDEYYKGIDKVDVSDVVAAAKKLFKPEKLNLAVIGPFESDKEFEKIIS